VTDRETEFREFAGARMESLRVLAYLTCGDWRIAEDVVLATLAKLYGRWHRMDNHEAYARTAVVRAAVDATRRWWWRRPDLPVRQRAALVLHFLEGLSVRQTAVILGFPESTVQDYTSPGPAAFRRMLDERTEERHATRTA